LINVRRGAQGRRRPAPRNSLNGGGAQDRVEQPREARLEIVAPERVHPGGSLTALEDHAGFAEHPEMVRAGRLRDRQVEAAARVLGAVAERRDNLQADGIAERVQYRGELDVLALGSAGRAG
jgi:hypothetical protein